MSDLDRRRARRWWLDRGQVRTIERAVDFIDDVGFALLFPARGTPMPSLWSVGRTRRPGDDADDEIEWGPDGERMWGWKDEIPLRRLAWYGPLARGRKGFLSKDLLADLYPRRGAPEDYRDEPLSPEARRIADLLHASGPLPAAVVREATGLDGKRGRATFAKASDELGRRLVITHFGVEEAGGSWPSAVYELTARAFRIRPKGDERTRRRRAAGRFLDTMIEARASDLARTFDWSPADARLALDSLVSAGAAHREGPGFWRTLPRRG